MICQCETAILLGLNSIQTDDFINHHLIFLRDLNSMLCQNEIPILIDLMSRNAAPNIKSPFPNIKSPSPNIKSLNCWKLNTL